MRACSERVSLVVSGIWVSSYFLVISWNGGVPRLTVLSWQAADYKAKIFLVFRNQRWGFEFFAFVPGILYPHLMGGKRGHRTSAGGPLPYGRGSEGSVQR